METLERAETRGVDIGPTVARTQPLAAAGQRPQQRLIDETVSLGGGDNLAVGEGVLDGGASCRVMVALMRTSCWSWWRLFEVFHRVVGDISLRQVERYQIRHRCDSVDSHAANGHLLHGKCS